MNMTSPNTRWGLVHGLSDGLGDPTPPLERRTLRQCVSHVELAG